MRSLIMFHYAFTAESEGPKNFENRSTFGEVVGNQVPIRFLLNTLYKKEATETCSRRSLIHAHPEFS